MIFNKNAKFNNVVFIGEANFSDSTFNDYADFYNVTFNSNVKMNGCKFGDVANFMDVVFVNNADFNNVNFNGIAYFIDASFNGDAYFRSAKFGYVDFSRTDFNKNVDFHIIDFQKMVVTWSSLEDGLTCDGLVYTKLIKNFRDMERFDDADKAYYQYRTQSRKDENWLSWGLSLIMDITCGYGVKPFKALIVGGLTILVFTLIYWRKNGISRLKENGGDEDQNVSCWDALYFSMFTFTTIGYGDWYPKDRFRKYVVIEGLLGWLILALFLVTSANVMIRP